MTETVLELTNAGATALFDAGTPQTADSAAPFLLAGDDVWLVASGHVDVFAVQLDANGDTVGGRAHLLRVSAGRPLFGLGGGLAARGRGLLAVGAAGTQLQRLPQRVLREHARTVEGAREAAALLDDWVEALCDGVSASQRDVVPSRCVELSAGAEVDVAAGTTARPRRGVAWLRHVAGHSHLLGRDELTVNGVGLTPISRRAWLEVREPGRVVLLDSADVADPDALWGGLARLHDLVLHYTELLAAQTAAAERTRLRRRAEADRVALHGACARLASTMDPRAGHAAPQLRRREDAEHPPAWDDALFAACRLVGETMDVAARPYARGAGAAAPRDPLAAIARASRLRTRQVALRDEWWQRDNGPLLAYVEHLAEEGGEPPTPSPVALLPTPDRRGYVLHDPLARTARPLTAALAATLGPFAQTFYRPFPDAALGVMDVVRFGLRGCRRDLLTVVAMGIAGALLGLIPSIATGVLFNDVIPGAQRPQLWQMTAVLLVCATATALFTVVRGLAVLRIEGRMSSAVQSAVWDRLLSLPMPFFRPYAAGDLAVRAMGIDGIRQVVSGSTVSAILGGIFSLFNFGLMFWYSPTMAWRASLLIVIAVVVTAFGSLRQLRHQRGVSAIQAKVSGVVLQLLSGVAKLRVAGAEAQAFTRWAARFGEQRRAQYRVTRIANLVAAFNGAFPVVANVVIFWAAMGLLRGEGGNVLRTGDFLAFLSAYGTCQAALLGTCGALLMTLSTVPLYEQAEPILRARPEVDDAKGDPGRLAGEIEIQHAVFRYDGDGPPVLRDVTLRVKPGEFVALVGPSGSGKSTILRLLLGFERLESGAIYYDGQELDGLDIQAVRRQIGVVLQNGQLMSGDIYTNIAGSSQISMDDAWEAARMAGFDADVKAMPMGMHTVVSEGGGTLSGGQRQRLMIARAIVHRPRILFFDEATSALDNRTQAIVSESLERLNATRVVVAHRLSTIVNADRIVVIKGGQIVESGRYDELMVNDGLFAELARRQLA